MIERLLNSEHFDLVQRSLDASALQHRVISNNLANVDTPGFKRAEVIFQEKLKKALEKKAATGESLEASRTDGKHLPFSEAEPLSALKVEAEIQNHTTLRNDGNNVDIDIEMSKLAQNTVLYQALSQMVQGKLATLRTAINEGRR